MRFYEHKMSGEFLTIQALIDEKELLDKKYEEMKKALTNEQECQSHLGVGQNGDLHLNQL